MVKRKRFIGDAKDITGFSLSSAKDKENMLWKA